MRPDSIHPSFTPYVPPQLPRTRVYFQGGGHANVTQAPEDVEYLWRRAQGDLITLSAVSSQIGSPSRISVNPSLITHIVALP